MTRRIPAALLAGGLLALSVLLAACGGASSDAPTNAPAATVAPSASPASGIVRAEIGGVVPGNAPGLRLTLWHYIIPAGSKLPAHNHPGWQIAQVKAGTLTYTILTGEAEIHRADGTVETHKAGDTIDLNTGDAIIENPDEHHQAANNGTVDIELITTTLLTDGAPVAQPDPTPAPSS